MPSKTPKQARFMAACAHGAGYASCPPAKVSKEFNQADMAHAQGHKTKTNNFTGYTRSPGRPKGT